MMMAGRLLLIDFMLGMKYTRVEIDLVDHDIHKVQFIEESKHL